MNTGVIAIDGVELIDMKLAKQHLRLDTDYNEEDALIDIAIASAISQAENYISRKLVKSHFVLSINSSESIVVERLSLNDKIVKVEIMEEGVDSIILPISSFRQNKIGPEHYEISFTDVSLEDNQSLKVTLEIGYDSDNLPGSIKSALLLLIGDSYEKREDRNQGSNMTVNNLLRPYRKWL